MIRGISLEHRCEFCDDYKFQKKLDRKHESDANNDPECRYAFKHSYKVKMVSVTQRREKGSSSRYHDGGTLGHGNYPLNFCPVCGRKLR